MNFNLAKKVVATLFFVILASVSVCQQTPGSHAKAGHSPHYSGHKADRKQGQQNNGASSNEDAQTLAYKKDNQQVIDFFSKSPGTSTSTENAGRTAQHITSSRLYGRVGQQQSENWIGSTISNWLNRFNRHEPRNREITAPNLGPLALIFDVLIGLTILGLIGLGFYYLIKIQRVKRVHRASLVEDGEIATTADEWMAASQKYAQQGDFRKAIRCAYISGLLQFDYAKIARFERHQTNWEHLERIEASPQLPIGIDYRQETNIFDRVWYGMFPVSHDDYQRFVTSVLNLKKQLGDHFLSRGSVEVGVEIQEEVTK